MIRRSSLAVFVAGTTLALSANAWARAEGTPTGPASSSDEITTLETNLANEHAALSTTDCATACRALASIRRAADRICALDPDARCTAARAKADDATQRVRETCPECAVASSSPQPSPPVARPARKGGAAEPGADSPVETVANAPPSESRRGGCAGCTTSSSSPTDLRALGVALSALALLVGRRRRR